MNNEKRIPIPFVGIVGINGHVESYDYETAEKNDFHHNFIMSQKGLDIYNNDDTLRFVMYSGSCIYTLEGGPSLDPFGAGETQIRIFASHALAKGAPLQTPIQIAEQNMLSEWEGRLIGSIEDWL